MFGRFKIAKITAITPEKSSLQETESDGYTDEERQSVIDYANDLWSIGRRQRVFDLGLIQYIKEDTVEMSSLDELAKLKSKFSLKKVPTTETEKKTITMKSESTIIEV